MLTLSYSGQYELETNVRQQAKQLLDALLQADADDTPLTVDSGQIRPRGDTTAVLVSVSAEGDVQTIEAVQDSLAQAIVDLDLEQSLDDAVEEITIS